MRISTELNEDEDESDRNDMDKEEGEELDDVRETEDDDLLLDELSVVMTFEVTKSRPTTSPVTTEHGTLKSPFPYQDFDVTL